MTKAQFHINSGTINFKQKQISLATQNVSRAIQSSPQNSMLYSNRAILQFTKGKHQQAQKNLQKSKIISPLHYLSYYNQFVADYKSNVKKRALQNLLLSIYSLYIKRAISQNSSQILTKVLCDCCLTFQSENNKFQQVKLCVKPKKKNEICELNEQQLQESLRQQLQMFKNLLKVQKLKFLSQKVIIDNQSKHEIILSKEKASINQHDQFKTLSELKKLIFEDQLKERQIIKSKKQANKEQIQQQSVSQLHNSAKIATQLNNQAKLATQLNNQANLASQLHYQANFNTLNLQSSLKPDQNQKSSLKKKANFDDSFDLNQMSLNMKKITPKQQMNNSHHNISSTSYKKNKEKKKQDIYPCQNKSQQLEVKIVMGQITNNKELFGSMDPYCVLQYNGQSKKTSVIKGGGVNPRWNQFFKFKLSENRSQLSIKVYDRERFKFKDDFIGQARFVVQKKGFVKLPIYQNQSPAGFIFISIDSK